MLDPLLKYLQHILEPIFHLLFKDQEASFTSNLLEQLTQTLQIIQKLRPTRNKLKANLQRDRVIIRSKRSPNI